MSEITDPLIHEVVHIVDDDAAMRDAMAAAVRTSGYAAAVYRTGADFLAQAGDDAAGCVVTDVRMPEMDGLAFHRSLRAAGVMLPVIFVSGYADVALGVRAMQDGAFTFLTKPFREQDLLEAIAGALAQERGVRGDRVAMTRLRSAFDTLDPRERQIMRDVADGQLNKVIATRLGLSEITVKVIRAKIMRKIGAPTVAHLARIAERLGIV